MRQGGGLEVGESVVLVEDKCIFGIDEWSSFVVSRDILALILWKYIWERGRSHILRQVFIDAERCDGEGLEANPGIPWL